MALRGFFNQPITIENPTDTLSRQGKPGFSDAVSTKARFERTNKTIVTAERDREPIHGDVFVAAEESVLIGARITYEGVQYRVMGIEDVVDMRGRRNHLELLVQLWSFSS